MQYNALVGLPEDYFRQEFARMYTCENQYRAAATAIAQALRHTECNRAVDFAPVERKIKKLIRVKHLLTQDQICAISRDLHRTQSAANGSHLLALARVVGDVWMDWDRAVGCTSGRPHMSAL